jgi:hypothetical protein
MYPGLSMTRKSTFPFFSENVEMVAVEEAKGHESVGVNVVAVSETATQITILDAAIQVRFCL